MDPLSISASLITVLGVGGKLSKGLRKYMKLKDAPQVLQDLNDAISGLRLAANGVDEVIQTAKWQYGIDPPENVVSAVGRMKSTLLKLESFVSYDLTIPSASGTMIRVDRSVLLRSESRLKEFKENICAEKINLSLALNTFATSMHLEGLLYLRQIPGLLTLMSNNIDKVATHVFDTHYDPSTGAHIPATSQALVKTGKSREGRNNIVVKSQHPGSLIHLEPLHPHHGISPLVASNKCETSKLVRGQDATKIAQTSRRACDVSCRCTCHSYHLWRLRYFRSILGSLSITRKGSSLLKGTCDDTRCLSSPTRTTCVYAFPFWLLDGIISISYSCELAKGPELLLRVMRTRDFTPLNRMVHSNETWAIIEMKRMLGSGEISVFDIDEDGDSILYNTVVQGSWDLAQLLISYGADMQYTGATSEYLDSPIIRAFRYQIEDNSLDGCVKGKCQALISQSSIDFDIFDFSDLHKAYLGLIPQDFGEILTPLRREDINQTDFQDKTVLHWAAMRGDTQTIAQLLDCGADPNRKDFEESSPLHFAVQNNVASVELLLTAKADVTATDKWGRTPMHYMDSSTTSSIQRLIDLGADIESSDHRGCTPLHMACYYEEVQFVEKLLSCGANINVQVEGGDCPLHIAILRNNNHTLSMVTSNPHLDYSTKVPDGWSVVELATAFGDVQILDILGDVWPASLELGSESDVSFLWEEAEYRRDHNEHWSRKYKTVPDEDPVTWFNAFVNMVETISERYTKSLDSACRSLDSEDESNDCEGEEYDYNDEARLSEDGLYDSGDETSNSEEEAWEIALEYVEDPSPIPDVPTLQETPQPASSDSGKGSQFGLDS